MRATVAIGLCLWLARVPLVAAACERIAADSAYPNQITLTVLGSGGPEITDGLASTSYLVTLVGGGTLLVDAGPGSALNFERSGARFEDLQALLLTHLHVDHSADLPAYIKGSYFTDRAADLPVYGPDGNDRMPSTTTFIDLLFGPDGAWRYLEDYLREDSGEYHLRPHNIPLGSDAVRRVPLNPDVQLGAVPVHHGPIPAVAWRVETAGCTLVFSGDTSDRHDSLLTLARGADVLVAHNPVPQSASGAAINLHMRPAKIGKIAAAAGVSELILSHRMTRSLGREGETLAAIRQSYAGPVTFAGSLQVFRFARTDQAQPGSRNETFQD